MLFPKIRNFLLKILPIVRLELYNYKNKILVFCFTLVIMAYTLCLHMESSYTWVFEVILIRSCLVIIMFAAINFLLSFSLAQDLRNEREATEISFVNKSSPFVGFLRTYNNYLFFVRTKK